MFRKLVTVVIPTHLPEPSELEKISLDQILAVLHRHPITFMVPTELDTSWYENYCQGKASIRFARFQWKGHQAYSELIMSTHFFRAFKEYQYMLVYHLDAFVFRDELEQWCQQGYDYVGSVIYEPRWQQANAPLHKLLGFSYPEYFGNGGFALKKIDSFYRLTSTFKLYIKAFCLMQKKRKKMLLEDLFITHHFPWLSSSFRIAPLAAAQRFGVAYECGDAEKLPFTNQDVSTLPFGMHGWIRLQHEYWKPTIQHFGHQF